MPKDNIPHFSEPLNPPQPVVSHAPVVQGRMGGIQSLNRKDYSDLNDYYANVNENSYGVPESGAFGPKDLPDFLRRVGNSPAPQLVETALTGNPVGLMDSVGLLSNMLPQGESSSYGPSTAITRMTRNEGGREVPDLLLRNIMKNKFLESASKYFTLPREAEKFAEKYPRVAAHMNVRPELMEDLNNAARAHVVEPEIASGAVEKYGTPIDISFSRRGLSRPPRDIRNTLYHEATHVAQKLGDPDMPLKYRLAKVIVPYKDIPYERTAAVAGLKARDNAERFIPMRDSMWQSHELQKYTAPRGLMEITDAKDNPGKYAKKGDKASNLYDKMVAAEMLHSMLTRKK